MGCFQSSTTDEGVGFCGMASVPEERNEGPTDSGGEDNKPGQKPSEVLRLSRDVTSGLSKTYQKVSSSFIYSLPIKFL